MKTDYPIKHVVVLMEENRSFDHMLGWMTKGGPSGDPRVDGIYGNECNPEDINGGTKYVCVTEKAEDINADPTHSFEAVTEQIFACKDHFQPGHSSSVPGHEEDPCYSHASTSGAPSMMGFADQFRRKHSGSNGSCPLDMHPLENLPIMTKLAKEFALFDKFFCSHPGPTDPNRMFVHTGTAHGNTETGECRKADDCGP